MVDARLQEMRDTKTISEMDKPGAILSIILDIHIHICILVGVWRAALHLIFTAALFNLRETLFDIEFLKINFPLLYATTSTRSVLKLSQPCTSIIVKDTYAIGFI